MAKPVERAVVKTPPSATGKGSRTSLPEYPPASRRAGEAGTVQLRCFVKEDGRCSEVSVVKSSGFDKLDEAAVKEAQRNWKFVPGKEDELVTRRPSTDEPFSALAFKVATHPFFGKLTYVRVYSGKVDSG